ncbi:putative effector protein [Ceratobasidium theobromae]|uniref:Putative effector protein n=1 Tax=Ceratobasidium theobromae TaxID=1582974 RepID=A0A5N5QNM9_9AGAM|nr:putative effector protein [Ceratobasidium theobromae]
MRALTAAFFISAASSVMAIPGTTVTADKGWGTGFCAATNGLTQCTNLASSGKTTVTWQAQPQYKIMLDKCKMADTYALVQFGHNDQKYMNTQQFAANLTSLTNTIKNAGCSPVLLTSLARRKFSKDKKTQDNLGPYSAETIKLASNLGLPHAQLLPLLADSRAYLDKLGEGNAMKFNYADGDTTHLNALGAKYFGRIVADEVKAKIPTLSNYVVADAALSGKIAAGTL